MKKYLISSSLTTDLTCADVLPKEPYILKDEPCQHCPNCGALSYGLKWVPPYNVTFNKKTIGDISLWDPLIVSQKFKDVYEQNNLTGIRNFCLVEQATSCGKEINLKFYVVELERINGQVNYKKTKIKGSITDTKKCICCNPIKREKEYVNGIYFDEEFKLDIFYTYDWGNQIFLSEKFVKVMISNGITNLESNIEECEKYIFPKWPQEDYEKAIKLRK